jgi:hypothetical protein
MIHYLRALAARLRGLFVSFQRVGTAHVRWRAESSQRIWATQ